MGIRNDLLLLCIIIHRVWRILWHLLAYILMAMRNDFFPKCQFTDEDLSQDNNLLEWIKSWNFSLTKPWCIARSFDLINSLHPNQKFIVVATLRMIGIHHRLSIIGFHHFQCRKCRFPDVGPRRKCQWFSALKSSEFRLKPTLFPLTN